MIKNKLKFTVLKGSAEAGFALISAVAILAILLVMVLAFATASIFEQRMANNNANTANNKALRNSVANMICNLLNRNGQYPIEIFLPEDGSTGKLIVNPINDAIKDDAAYQGLENDSNLYKILEVPGVFEREMTGMWSNPADDFKWLMLRDSDQEQVISRLSFVMIPNYGIGVTTYLNSNIPGSKIYPPEGDNSELRKGRNVEEIDAAWVLTGNASDHSTMLAKFNSQKINASNNNKYLDVNTFFQKVYDITSINKDMPEDERKSLVAMNHYYAIPPTRQQEAFFEIENTGTAEAPVMTTKAYHRFNLARNWDALYTTKPTDDSSLPDYENLKQRKPDELVNKLLSPTKDVWKANEKIKDDKATSIPWFQDKENSFKGDTTTPEVKQFAANIADYFDSDLMPSSDVHPKFWALNNSAMTAVYETPSDEDKNKKVTFGDAEASKLKSGNLQFTGVEAVPALVRTKLLFNLMAMPIAAMPDETTGEWTYSLMLLTTADMQLQTAMLFGNNSDDANNLLKKMLENYNVQLDVFVDGEIEVKNNGTTHSFKLGTMADSAGDNFHFTWQCDPSKSDQLLSSALHIPDVALLAEGMLDPVNFDGLKGTNKVEVSLKNFKIKRMVISGVERDNPSNIIGWDFVNALDFPDKPAIHTFEFDGTPGAPMPSPQDVEFEFVTEAKDPLCNLNKAQWTIKEPKKVTSKEDLPGEYVLNNVYKERFGLEKLTDTKLPRPLPHRSGASYNDRGTTNETPGDKISFMELNFIHQGEENKFFNLADKTNNNVTILDYLKLEDKPSNYKVNLSLLTQPLFQELFEKIHVHLTPEESASKLHTFNVDNLADYDPVVAYRLGEKKTPIFSNGTFSIPEIPTITGGDQAKAQQQVNSRSTLLRDYLLQIYPDATLTDMERSEIIAKTANLVNTNYIVTKDAAGTLSAYTPFPGYTVLAVIQNVKERERTINGKKDFIVLSEKKIKVNISGNNGKYQVDSIQNLPIPLP